MGGGISRAVKDATVVGGGDGPCVGDDRLAKVGDGSGVDGC